MSVGNQLLKDYKRRTGLSITDLAKLMDCAVGTINNLIYNNTSPGRRLSQALKRTAKIPLKAWDEEENARQT